jgi:hypothetical protein
MKNGAGLWAITTWITLLGHAIVCVLSLKYWEKKITFSDKIALYSALSIIPIWILTENDVLAVILASSIDIISLYPTLRKSYNKPYEENVLSKIMSGTKDILSLLIIQNFIFVNVFYILTIGISTLFSAIFILVRRHSVSKK